MLLQRGSIPEKKLLRASEGYSPSRRIFDGWSEHFSHALDLILSLLIPRLQHQNWGREKVPKIVRGVTHRGWKSLHRIVNGTQFSDLTR